MTTALAIASAIILGIVALHELSERRVRRAHERVDRDPGMMRPGRCDVLHPRCSYPGLASFSDNSHDAYPRRVHAQVRELTGEGS